MKEEKVKKSNKKVFAQIKLINDTIGKLEKEKLRLYSQIIKVEQ